MLFQHSGRENQTDSRSAGRLLGWVVGEGRALAERLFYIMALWAVLRLRQTITACYVNIALGKKVLH